MKIYGITVILNKTEYDNLTKPVRGRGGFQTLLREFQSSIDADHRQLTLDYIDIEKIQRYQKKYGNGGFQGRLPGLLKALRDIEQ